MDNTNLNNAGIYLITNKVNNKVYIGSTKNFLTRWRGHKTMLNRLVHFNTHLQAAWNKYGEENFKFSILEIVDLKNHSELYLREREEYYIEKYNSKDRKFGYNSRIKCDTNLGIKWPEESRKKFSEYRKLNIVEAAVKALNEYSKTRIGKPNEAARNYYYSMSEQEKKNKIKQLVEGHRKLAEERGCWHSEETQQKILDTKKSKGLIKNISLYYLNGKLYKAYSSYAECLRDFEDSPKNSACLIQGIKTGKLYKGFIVSTSTKETIPYFNRITKLVNSNKNNWKYAQCDLEGNIIKIFSTKSELCKTLKISYKDITKAINNNMIFNNYYWKIIEPISSNINRKEGEFSENPEVENTEPSFKLKDEEGATTNA